MKMRVCFIGLFLMLLGACNTSTDSLFVRVPSSKTNITFSNKLVSAPELNILNYLYYYNGAGIAAGDYNNDGLIDLYFTSNQQEDKLYLNKGDFVFQDITENSNISNANGWTTGVTHVDINNDGLLDIYICKVNDGGNLKGKNLFYINQGINASGIPFFKEEAAAYGLDFSGYSTKATFFDYDLDGDLDMYLLNHSLHPNRTYGKGNRRADFDPKAGDRLFRNNAGQFEDVSSKSGVFQGDIGYGLGLAISDLNNDGYPDIYIGNDFFENDYLYINQQDGTFKELISADPLRLGHTSHFSMGNDIADINNDGLTDIISLDMLPEDLKTYKTSGLEYPYSTYQQYLKNGYAPQYMQNTLHLNLGENQFSEVAELSNIPATEWSWGALLADFDNDGYKDLFVSNGIKGATNDMDFINFIANDNIQKRIAKGMTEKEMAFINEIPEKKVANYFFKNENGLSFADVTEEWHSKEASFSNGCVYADLDNDGDLDIVVNNVDEEAFLLRNQSEKNQNANSVQITFKGGEENSFGIGVKVYAYMKKKKITVENFPSRAYLSAIPNRIHLGIGKDSIIDSLTVHWPTGHTQKLFNIDAQGIITLKKAHAKKLESMEKDTRDFLDLKKSATTLDFIHREKNTVEFNRDPLVPFASTNEGPDVSVADVDLDGREDIFINGAKTQASALFLQNASGQFIASQESLFGQDAFNEDTSSTFFDADNDGYLDLLVVSGGNEFKSSKKLWPRFYRNRNGRFVKDSLQFKNYSINASKVISVDYDNDTDMDIVITADQVPWAFGKSPTQYVFENDGQGNFKDKTKSIAPELRTLGNIKDIIAVDLDGNGFKDLIAVGHWMPISIFLNNGKTLKLLQHPSLKNTHGWWNAVKAADFDQDGDIDIVAGNWGLNSKFNASLEEPLTLYSKDFDDNGSIEPLVTYFYNGQETPFASKDELTKQMPGLNKRFLSYSVFADQNVGSLFGQEKLDKAYKKKVYELASCHFMNEGDFNFTTKPLPFEAQVSTINTIWIEDFDADGHKDILAVGNNYEISTQLGRMDASHGLFLNLDKTKNFQNPKDWKIRVSGPARSIAKILIGSEPHYIIGMNNAAPVFLSKKNSN